MIDRDSDNPELYLFLSADIIGSTQLKYSNNLSSQNQNWYDCFLSFYTEFPEQLNRQ